MRIPYAGGSRPDRGPSRLLRAYAVTGGRTRPRHAGLEIESLVSTTEQGYSSYAALNMERRTIARLCLEVLSIAEVSAYLDLPLGVTRVLVGDTTLFRSDRPVDPDGYPDLALLQRVLAGLRAV